MNRPSPPPPGSQAHASPPHATRPLWLPEGPCADLVARRGWSGTPLGPLPQWPRSLRTVLATALRAPGPMAVLWGPEGVLLYNDAMAALAGDLHPHSFGEPASRGMPDFREFNARAIEACLDGRPVSLRASPGAFPHGGELRRGWFDVDYLPVPGDDDRPAGALATIADVTARVAAEREAAEGETRLRALADNLPGALVYQLETSRDLRRRRYAYVSAHVEPLMGIPPEEALGDPHRWLDTVHPEDLSRLARAEAEAARTLGVLDIEVRSRHPDGREVVGRIVSRPREVEGGLVWDGLYLDVTDQRAAEAEHRRTEALLRAIGAGLPDLIFAKDRDGRLLYANPAVERLIGKPVSELLGRNEAEWAPGSSEAEAIAEGDRRLMAEGRAHEIEEVFTGADGVTRVFRTVKSPLRDDAGAVVGLVGLSVDVTEARRARDSLQALNATLEERVAEALAERKLLADVFEGTDAMISVADTDLRLLAFNGRYADEVEKLGGHRPKVGDRIPDLYADHPELAAPAEANWRRAVAGETYAVVEEHGDPSRYRRSYERRFEPIRNREGRLIGAYQYATDVTERLRDQRRAAAAEAAQREADALYRAYFQNSAEGLFVVGVLPDGGFTFEQVNPTHRALLGFDIASQGGKRIEEVLPPEVAETVAANYRRVLETGETQRYRESGEIGGRLLHAETVLVPVRDEEGRIVRIVGSGRDMTAQVQAEEALRQSQKLESMGSLTGGVAHDFNNLLTPIIGGLDMLQRRGVGDERARRMVDGALQSAERARTLVQRLLAFARRQPLQPVAVDLGALVDGMAGLVASTVGPRIRVEVAVEEGLPPVRADANQLEMAILNLAVNARDAMPAGGTLRLSAARGAAGPAPATLPATLPPGAFARLSVADTGTGMDEATRARAVEPFFSTKGVGKGTGLGLSMVHGLASQLGGALDLRSRPGEGTEVALWLPLAEEPVADGPGAARSSDVPRAGLALLVDDEDLVRASTAQMLSDLGYEVAEAGSAEEALRVLESGLAADLVVTDHLMPGITGVELARNLAAAPRPLPVLLISGYAEEGVPPGLPRLAKPFRQAELAAALAGLLPPLTR